MANEGVRKLSLEEWLQMKMAIPFYTVSRCRKDDTLYGKVHGSEDCQKTTCGLEMDEKWWILSNSFQGKEMSEPVSCPKCKKELKNV